MIYEGNILKVTFREISEHLQEKEVNALFNVFEKGTSRYRARGAGSWKFWEHITPTSKVIVDYDSIPPQTIKKYNIPSKQQFIDQILAVQKAEQNWKQSAIEDGRVDLPNAIAKDDAVIRSWYLDRLSSIQPKNPKLWKRLVNDYTRLSLWMQYIARADKSKGSLAGKLRKAAWNDAALVNMLSQMR